MTCAASLAGSSACVMYGPLGTPRLEMVRVVLGAVARRLAGTGQWVSHTTPPSLAPSQAGLYCGASGALTAPGGRKYNSRPHLEPSTGDQGTVMRPGVLVVFMLLACPLWASALGDTEAATDSRR